MTGTFYGIGVGPGDPELLTLKAQRILSTVDVLCVPKSKMEKDSLALSVVRGAVTKEYTLLELQFPMSRNQAILEQSWQQAGARVAGELLAGRDVAFITIGDPTLYSTYGYLLRYLRTQFPDVPTETVPGVSSITACPAYIQEPLVEGDEKLAVIPAAYNLEDLHQILDTFDTVVLMKVNRQLPKLLQFIKNCGNFTTHFVHRCGYPDQFATQEPETILDHNLHYMSLMIVKKRRDSQ